SSGNTAPKVLLDLENPGNADLNWSINPALPWVTATTATGTLMAGATAQVELQLTPEALLLGAGSHETTLNIVNVSDGLGNVGLPLTIQLPSANSRLEFTPAAADFFTGGFGG